MCRRRVAPLDGVPPVGTLLNMVKAAVPRLPAADRRSWRDLTATVGIVVFGVIASFGARSLLAHRSSPSVAGETRVQMANVAFSPARVVHAGSNVTVAVVNKDLFWHTFTVPELGVEVRVPAGSTRHIHFTATAGQYRFVCRIPGHVVAGMNGTLTIT